MKEEDRLIVAAPTFFDENYSLDIDSFRNHIQYLKDKGVRNILVGGYTGEFDKLSRFRTRITGQSKYVKEIHLNSYVNITDRSLEETINNTLYCDSKKLVVAPSYFAKNEEDMINSMQKIAETGYDIILYINDALGNIEVETVKQIAKIENVFGAKISTRDKDLFKKYVKAFKRKDVWYGDDILAIFNLSDKKNYGIVSGFIGNIEPESLVNLVKGKNGLTSRYFDLYISNSWMHGKEISAVKTILKKRGITRYDTVTKYTKELTDREKKLV